jgi:hypothetical protein
VLRQNTYHLRVPFIRVLLQRPVPLQAQLHIPQRSYSINGGIFDLVLELEVGRDTPELDKRRHELTLIALNANMRQAHSQIILQQALNDTTSINLFEREINGQLVNEIQPISSDIIVQYQLHMRFRNDLDPTVLYKLDQGSEEDLPALFVLLLVGNVLANQRRNEFFHDHLEQEVELFRLRQELNRLDKGFQILFIFYHAIQIRLDILFRLELAYHPINKLNYQLLHVPAQLLLTAFRPQIELIRLLVYRYQEQHALFVLAVDPQQVCNQLPVAIHVHAEVLFLVLHQVVYLCAGVLVGKTVCEGHDVLELDLRL